LEFQAHSEALTNVLLLLKRIEPTQDLLKHVLNRDAKRDDLFVVSVLKFWIRNHEKKLAELLSTYLTKSTSSPLKRGKRNHTTTKDSLSTTAEQILMHLDHLRQGNKINSFFNQEALQTALTAAQSICSDSHKTRFSDLFALAEDYEPKSKKGGKNSKNQKGKAKPVDDSNTETDASDDEAISKTNQKPPRKKTRKNATTLSDSDWKWRILLY